MADLFLSYAREDRECAELLARALTERGWSVWWDRQIQVGRSFSEVIETELTQARCVVVLWSRHSLQSDWVQNEAAEASRKRSLVPVRIEDVMPPLEFRRLQTADLFDWRRGFDTPEFEKALQSIEMMAGATAARPLPSRPATRPAPTPAAQTPPVYQQPIYQQPLQQPGVQPAVQNFLVPSILVTLFCCIPLGIVAIVKASQVNSKLAAGDIAGAQQAAQQAKQFCLFAVIAAVVCWGLYFVLVAANNGLNM